MKKYTKPEAKITFLNNEEVLMVSVVGGINTGSTKFNVTGKSYSNLHY